MSKPPKYVPKHRHAPEPSALTKVPRKVLRSTVVTSGLAAAATGLAVSAGVLAAPGDVASVAEDLGSTVSGAASDAPTVDGSVGDSADDAVDREPTVSRAFDRRDAPDPAKKAALSVDDGPAVTRTVSLADGDPRDIAQALMPQFGFGSDQFGCLDSLWTRESNWDPAAHNPSSGAHGIPQSLPGSKMATAGPDWETNPVTQITWGLGYIQDRYGSPCSAWAHSESVGWY
ncbi:lytic transglycosylase domain-containing protein [Nocardioides sp. SR21]|uniref:aggregation-promoting factor C-terminal-like domain-containing protein n=1 Tax=Nocardioides sp. SR21 TaxID=2919501 RepID=UPI001FAA2481|nr:lytic transglycosylase domain-containing protein [Nocardioides sp. SR21]